MERNPINLKAAPVSYLMVYYILFQMPVVRFYVNTYVSMVLIVLLLASLLMGGKIDLDAGGRFFVTSILFLVLTLVDWFFREGNILYAIWNVLLTYLPLILGFFLITFKMEKAIQTVVSLIILTYFITCITTYIGLQQYPMASRDLASGLYDHSVSYTKMNIGGFEFIYSLVVAHPMFVYVFRRRNKPLLAVLATAILGICVAESKYTLAVITFVLSLVVYLIPAKDTRKMGVGALWMAAAVLFVGFVLAPEILEWLSEIEILRGSSDKLLDVARMLQGEDVKMSNTEARQDVYLRSWESFLNYPVAGGRWFSKTVSGGHSYILDTMAKYGIIGLSWVLAVVWALIKWYRELFGNSNTFYYTMLSLGLALILAAVNPIFWAFELGVIIPLFAYCELYITGNSGKSGRRVIKIKWR